jgi:hypothetical protein
MRVLHVIDAGRPLLREFARPRLEETFDDRALACRLLIERSGHLHDHRVCVLGWRRAVSRAGEVGLPIDAAIPSMLGRAHLSVSRVSALVRRVRPDIVHWWHPRWTGGVFGRPGRAWRLEAILGSTPMKLPLWLSRAGALACGPAEEATARRAGLEGIPLP